VVCGDQALKLFVVGRRVVVVVRDQPTCSLGATEIRRMFGSQLGVMKREGESCTPAGRRHPGQPGEESRRYSSQDHAGHPMGKSEGAHFSNLAEIVQERGDKEIMVFLAPRAKDFANAAEMGLIVERQPTEGGSLAIG
jgi:hypothetical protein